MENQDGVVTPPNRKKPFILFRLWQWLVVAFFGLLAIMVGENWTKLNLPGAPDQLYWPTVIFLVILALVHIPSIFFRLAPLLRLVGSLALILGLMMAGTFLGRMQAAYNRTPAGQKEIAIAAAAQAKVAAKEAARNESQKKTAELADLTRQLAEIQDKLKGCLSWGGRLPALEDMVQSSLHNPKSFEHVRTVLIDPDENSRNVIMEFRGENGFGALRTAQVKAQLSPETCEISNPSEPATE